MGSLSPVSRAANPWFISQISRVYRSPAARLSASASEEAVRKVSRSPLKNPFIASAWSDASIGLGIVEFVGCRPCLVAAAVARTRDHRPCSRQPMPSPASRRAGVTFRLLALRLPLARVPAWRLSGSACRTARNPRRKWAPGFVLGPSWGRRRGTGRASAVPSVVARVTQYHTREPTSWRPCSWSPVGPAGGAGPPGCCRSRGRAHSSHSTEVEPRPVCGFPAPRDVVVPEVPSGRFPPRPRLAASPPRTRGSSRAAGSWRPARRPPSAAVTCRPARTASPDTGGGAGVAGTDRLDVLESEAAGEQRQVAEAPSVVRPGGAHSSSRASCGASGGGAGRPGFRP